MSPIPFDHLDPTKLSDPTAQAAIHSMVQLILHGPAPKDDFKESLGEWHQHLERYAAILQKKLYSLD